MTMVETDSGVLAGDERMLIDGELRYTASGAKFDVIDPATGEVAGQATDGTIADIDTAVGAAKRAFENTEWSRDVEFRYHCLMQLSAALEEEKERLRRIVTTEVGTPLMMSPNQIEMPLPEVAHWAEHGRRFEYLRDTGLHDTGRAISRRSIQYDPIGVVGAITPWNSPLYLNIAESMPPLMAGNAVVLKPAQLTPWSGSELGRLVAEKTDIPPGIFNVVLSNDNEVGAALSADPRVDMVTFTGSTAVGRKILAAGAPTVKRVMLELGGKSAHIVLDDVDMAAVMASTAMVGCAMSGQSCVLPSRILLPRSRYEEGLELLKQAMEATVVGDPWDPTVFQGPQISAPQQQKILGLIRSGVEDGARLVTGGGVPEGLERGYYVEPTVLANVDPDSMIAQHEVFGPVLCVIPYDTEAEAISIANNSIYGLSGEVSSGDEARAMNVALRLRTGSVTVNGGGFFGLTSPFGGYKQSGLGRRNGEQGFEEYLEIKTIGLPSI
jgi:acyl-CoA reductase-like NAD-dependent aldehyde dehydrogenase